MNGEERKMLSELFDAKLEPIAEGVKELSKKSDKHYKKIIVMEEKFKSVGNCTEHAASVKAVKQEIVTVDKKADTNGSRIWKLALVLLVAALGIAVKFILGI